MKDCEIKIFYKDNWLRGDEIPDDWYINLRDLKVYQVKIKFGHFCQNEIKDVAVLWGKGEGEINEQS